MVSEDTYQTISDRCQELCVQMFDVVNFDEDGLIGDGFLDLSPELLISLLSSDTLTVDSENIIFLGVLQWFSSNSQHLAAFQHIAPLIRFPVMDVWFLRKFVMDNIAFDSLPPDSDVRQLLPQAIDFAEFCLYDSLDEFPDNLRESLGVLCTPRPILEVPEFQIYHEFDLEHVRDCPPNHHQCFSPAQVYRGLCCRVVLRDTGDKMGVYLDVRPHRCIKSKDNVEPVVFVKYAVKVGDVLQESGNYDPFRDSLWGFDDILNCTWEEAIETKFDENGVLPVAVKIMDIK